MQGQKDATQALKDTYETGITKIVSHPEEAMAIFESLIEQARKANNKEYELKAAHGIGYAHSFKGEVNRSNAIMDSVLLEARARKVPYVEAHALYVRGSNLIQEGDFLKGTKDLHEALDILSNLELDEKKVLINTYQLLGTSNSLIGNYKEAKKYNTLAADIALQEDDTLRYQIIQYNLCDNLKKAGKENEALECFESFSNNYKFLGLFSDYGLLLLTYKALLSLNPSVGLIEGIGMELDKLEKEMGDFGFPTFDKIIFYLCKVKYHLIKKQPREAKRHLDLLDRLVADENYELRLEEQLSLLKQKVNYHKLVGNYQRALELHEVHSALRKEKIEQEDKRVIQQLNLSHAKEQEERELATRELELQAKKISSGRERRRLIILFASILIAGLVGFNLYLRKKNDIIDRAREAAERAAETQSSFINTVSHEIRTPLSTIVGSSFLLEKDNKDNKVNGYVRDIRYASNYLNNLVENTIVLKTLKRKDLKDTDFLMRPVEFNIRALVEQAIATANLDDNANSIAVDIDKFIPDMLQGPEFALHRILTNLVSNANKFTSKGLIKIRVGVTKIVERDITLDFTIADNGRGIPERDMKHVFDLFYRAGDSNGKAQSSGIGMGLNLVKQILEVYGKVPRLESVPGIGTSINFEMDFEILEGSASEEQGPQHKGHDADKANILLVEDNLINQKMAKRIIERLGYKCDVAENGKVAVESYRANAYKMVFMDIMMPIMDGFQAAKEINRYDPNAKIVALTALPKEKNLKKFEDAGLKTVINKPFDLKEIKKVIEVHLGS